MFADEELEKLRLRKELLVLECDARRLLLIAQWQRLSSPEVWLNEAGQAAQRHPWMTAVLGAGAGVFAIRTLRRPFTVLRLVGRIGGAIATLRSIWKYFGRNS
jgi:hypothetical protein